MPKFNGDQLKMLRISRLFTHADLAEELLMKGIKTTPTRVGGWETGREIITPRAIGVLADIFEVDPAVFVDKR